MRLELGSPWWLLVLLALPPVALVAWRSGSFLSRSRRAASVALRALVILLLALALADLQTVAAAERLGVVYLVDVSDSTGAQARPAARAQIDAALRQKPPGDQVAVVVFGATPLVERHSSPEARPVELNSVPDPTQTDLGAAVRLGLALFPEDAARRLVLLSDGNETAGSLERAAQVARAAGVRLDVVPAPPRTGEDVILESVSAPPSARSGESVSVNINIVSTFETDAVVRLFRDGSLLDERPVKLTRGANVVTWPVDLTEPGFASFAAQVSAAGDAVLRNNDGGAFTVVRGRPRVLVIEGKPDEAAALRPALDAGGVEYDVAPPERLPDNPLALTAYDAVVLVNVSALQLTGKMEPLQSYVRDLGHGLVAVGGDTSFRPGGWANTPLEATLPVTMEPKNRLKTPDVALVIVIDHSGSMAACPGPAGSCTGPSADLTRLEIARRTAFWTIGSLTADDVAGVITFDDKPTWLRPLGRTGDPAALQALLGGLTPDGGTVFGTALRSAIDALAASPNPRKHILLLSDGGASDGGLTDMVDAARASGITLSTVMAGLDGPELMKQLAQHGGGEVYDATAADSVPNIVAKETKFVERSAINEEAFQPVLAAGSAFLRDQGAPPVLRGFLGTTEKKQAEIQLTTPEGDPILASWQYGLGRSVAWTSDVHGRWSGDWLAWDGFGRFWTEVVRSVLPPAEDQSLRTSVKAQGADARIEADAVDAAGAFRNGLSTVAVVRAPSGAAEQVSLPQTAPGHYEGTFHPSERGAYIVSVLQAEGERPVAGQVTGFVQAYSPEYRAPGQDLGLLRRAADATGGGILRAPEAAFAHDIASSGARSPLWPPLLLLAILLWPVDIAARRLILTRADVARLGALVQAAGARLPRRAARPRAATAAAPLLVAKLRTRGAVKAPSLEPSRRPDGAAPALATPSPRAEATDPRAATPAAPPAGGGLDRLREAKRRAQR
jgi:uncharacterized membrane protein